jgi:PAS domain S-box-containing protein
MNFQMGCDDITQDYRIRTAWGDYQWVLNRTRMRRDRNGRVTHGQSIIHDITDRKRAEIGLQESERQMRALLDNIPDIVWLKDAQSRFIAVNEPFGKTCGAKPEDLVGKSDFDIWPKEMAEAYRADDQEVMQSGRTKRVEEPLEDAHGSQKWIETIKTPIRNDRGNVIGTTGIARDVTERKRVEELYRMLSDKSLAGVYVVQDGVFKYLNANAASYAGFSPEELVGSSSTILLHPEDRATAQERAGEMIRGVRQTPYEFRIIDKAGMTRWILETVTTIPYEGRPAVLGNSMDITQFKEAQQKLEELQALESSVLAAIPHAVIGLENRQVIFANDNVETVFGWKPAEIIGRDPAVFFSSGTDCDLLIGQIVHTLQTGTVYSAEPENPLVHREGRHFHCRVTASRIGSGAGEGVVATFEDVTERKRAQLQLLQSEKMASIGQLAAGVAHEINNPTGYVSSNLKTMAEYFDDVMGILQRYRQFLNGVRGLVEMAKLDGNLPGLMSEIEDMEKKIDIEYILKDAPSLIQESREGTERIKEIVLSLKNFAHPGEDRFVYSDVNRNMDSTLNVVWNELKYKATVSKEYGELPEIQCYPQQINQVFMNILVNAAQAIKTRGEIAIRTRSNDGEVEISISDTGVGIPLENVARVFDPFFTTKEVGKGTGLGLNVAYNIIKKHHGSIDVTSKVGEGTTFTIRLPVHQEEGKA